MIHLSDIVIVPKMSKYEYDRYRFKLSHTQMMKKYRKDGVHVAKIMKSHKRQKRALALLMNNFPKACFVSRNNFTPERADKAKLVIAFGGDNHFTYIAHKIQKTPLLGINADPLTSEGALMNCTAKKLLKNHKKIQKEKFRCEAWTRIEVMINHKKIHSLALSEVFLGEAQRKDMSRHILSYRNKHEEQKCSGVIISTGAGSTGWYKSVMRMNKKKPFFSRRSPDLKFVITEPYNGIKPRYRLLHGTLNKGEKPTIRSLNDARGILTLDSWETYSFKNGSTASVKSGKPLQVVRL